MKKSIFLIILLNTTLLFGYDLRGYWGLNVLTPEKIKFVNEKVSWGICKTYNTEEGFLIDINENGSFIKFKRWGKILINEIIESENSIMVRFNLKGKPSYIEFNIVTENEIYIKSNNTYFNVPNGLNNRFFKLEGPSNSISYPIKGKILKKQNLTWCGAYIGILPENLIVTVIDISNTSKISDSPDKKELIIRVDENELINFSDEYYKKFNLERTDRYVYGEIQLSDILLENDFELF